MQSSLAKCNVGLRSEVRCVPNLNAPWQTLNQLDASTVRASGQSKRISLMILSRVNVDFLNESYGQWTICPSHRKEYLDAWQVNKVCCHPCHVTSQSETPQGKHMITDVMAIKIMLNEGAVVPISGRICDSCKESYDLKYSSASGLGAEPSTSTKGKGMFTHPAATAIPIQSSAISQASKIQSTSAVSAQIIPVSSGHVFPAARAAPAANVTIIPISSGTSSVPQTVFLPARVVYPHAVTFQKQSVVQPLPVVVQLTEQPEPEARPKPRLKPASKTQSFARQVSSEENDQKKPKASRNQTTSHKRSTTPEEQPEATFWTALNLMKKDTENGSNEEYPSSELQNNYPVSIQMEDTLPNEYSVLNNYRQIFCYHIQRLVGISPRGYDRVRSSVIDAFLPPVENLIKVPPVQSVCRLRQYGALSSHLRPLKSFKKVGSVEVTKKVLGLRPKIFPKKKKLLVSSKMFNLKRARPTAIIEREDEDEALSIFSNDSDDDPTWAPSEDPRETTPLRPLKDKQSWKILKKKRRRSEAGPILTKKQMKLKIRQDRLEIKEARKRTVADRRRIRQEKLKKREERLRAQQEALQHLGREKALNGDNQKTDDQLEYHYVCNLCQISFYRETAFKHHMSSKIEYHKELREKLQIKKDSPGQIICQVCAMEFKVAVAYQIHMAVEHGTGLHPFFCQICNVNLKSESAFKSHNSKLHLERPARTYYCRVCEQLFECRLKHADHIQTHQNWHPSEPGMQCKYCGKVFSQFQSLIFHKHLATHDEEEEQSLPQKCTCRKCAQNQPTIQDGPESSNINLDTSGNFVTNDEPCSEVIDSKVNTNCISDPLRRKRKLETTAGQSKNPKIEENELPIDFKTKKDGQSEEEESSGPFQCGICSRTFSETISLSKHLKQFHQSSHAVNGGDSPLEQRTALSRKLVDLNKVVIVKPTEKNWQECVDRNWAAEFGYGKEKPKQLGDILEKMKQKFFTAASSDDESSGEGGKTADEDMKSKKLQGRRQRPTNDAKIPRILSQTSIRSRKRMETLLQRARDFMINETEYEAAASKEETVTEFPNETSSSFVSPTLNLVEPKLEDVDPTLLAMSTIAKQIGEGDNDGDELVDRNIEGLPELCDVADEIMPESKECGKTVSTRKLNQLREDTPNRRAVPKGKPNQELNVQVKEVKEEPVDTYSDNNSTQAMKVPSNLQFIGTKEISTLNKRQLRNRNSERGSGNQAQSSEIELNDNSNPQTIIHTPPENKFSENKLGCGQSRSDDQRSENPESSIPSTSAAVSGDVNAGTKVDGSTELSDLECMVDVNGTNGGLLIQLMVKSIKDIERLSDCNHKKKSDLYEIALRENGWFCEKNWSTRTDSFTTHFWSPDGQRHPTLGFIQAYARQEKLTLDMEIFRKAIKNNPPRRDDVANEARGKVRKTFADMAAKLNAKK